MDYSSLKGSGLSPQDRDILVKQRQTQYAKEIENDYDDWITNPIWLLFAKPPNWILWINGRDEKGKRRAIRKKYQ